MTFITFEADVSKEDLPLRISPASSNRCDNKCSLGLPQISGLKYPTTTFTNLV